MKEKLEQSIRAELYPGVLRKGNQTKFKIIQVAVEQIAREGIENLTFESVGKPLNMERAQIRYHFREKEELVDRAIEFVIASGQRFVIQRLQKARGWKNQIFAVFDAFFDWVDELPSHGTVLLYLFYSASREERRRALHNKLAEVAFTRIESLLRQSEDFASLSKPRLAALARSIWAVADGTMMQYMTTGPHESSEGYRRQLREAILKLVDVRHDASHA